MAKDLDIKRCWFHKDHYDIPRRRIEEIQGKCEIVSVRKIAEIVGRIKKAKNMPEFKNRENEKTKTEDGRTVFLSRSCAVAVTVFWKYIEKVDETFRQQKIEVLLVKRRDDMDTEPGRWCLPCGYLDYDESLYEAALRELFEETGVYIHDYLYDHEVLRSLEKGSVQPQMIHSEPGEDALQNVTAHFVFQTIDGKRPELKPQESEVQEVKFVPVSDLDQYDIAFGHAKRIRIFFDSLYQRG